MAQFFNAKTNKPLEDRDGRLAGSEGRVMADRLFSPRSPEATYGDLSLFIPLSQLHLPPGTRAAKCRVLLWDVSDERPVRLAGSDEITIRLDK